MTQTNVSLDNHAELERLAQVVLDASLEYHTAYRSLFDNTAVVWIKDTDNRLIVFTRGEYLSQIMHNVDHLHRDGEYFFNKNVVD